MAQARPNLPKSLEDIPNSKWVKVINEYIKGNIDKIIATRYYIELVPQEDIASEVGYSRSAIKKKLPKLLDIIQRNIDK